MTTKTLSVAAAAAAAVITASSAVVAAPAPITSVVVYRDRAQVSRTQSVGCAAGEAKFEGLPSTLDAKTLSATLAGGGGAVVGIKYREVASGPKKQAKVLQDKIRKIDVERVRLSGVIADARVIERKLSRFKGHMRRVWSQQAIGRNPPVKTWSAALDLLHKRALAAAVKRRAAEAKRRELWRERVQLRRELRAIERKRRRTTITVTAVLKCQGQRRVTLAYVVPSATWRVSYQLRAGQGSRVTLVAQAVVQQGTGEDWKNVRLSVSTANLQRKNTPPNIRRMRVSTHKPRDTRKILSRRFVRRRHLKVATATVGGKGGGGAGRGKSGAPGKPAGLAFELTAAKRVDVPADGREIVVTLARKSARAKLTYETVPKLYPYVYRKVSLGNPFNFTMIRGPVSIFRGRSYIGRAWVKTRAEGEPVEMSLGVENQLQIKRYKKVEKLVGAGAFGSTKSLHHRYEVFVGNWTRSTKRIVIVENIPVARVREIKVNLMANATKPTKINKDDGILRWVVRVPPRSQKIIKIGYIVKLPKSYIVRGY